MIRTLMILMVAMATAGSAAAQRIEGEITTATPTVRYGVTVIELQGTVMLPPTYGGTNPQWSVVIEFHPDTPPPTWWQQSAWQQPWTNGDPKRQAWSKDLVDFSGGTPNVPIDWNEGFYWIRPKFNCWSGNQSTSFYGDWKFFEVWYDE